MYYVCKTNAVACSYDVIIWEVHIVNINVWRHKWQARVTFVPINFPFIAIKECRFAKFQDLYSLRNFSQMKVYRNVGYVVEENGIFAIFTFYENYASQTRQPQRIILPTQGLMWPILPIFKLVFGFQYICKNALGSSMNFYSPVPISSLQLLSLTSSTQKKSS